MEHSCGIANATRIHGHIDDLLLDVRCLACVAIFQEKCAPAPFEALPTAIPLLALPRHAMAHNIRALTVGAVKYLKNHASTLVCWSVTVQVVKTGIMPRRVLADRFREAETEP